MMASSILFMLHSCRTIRHRIDGRQVAQIILVIEPAAKQAVQAALKRLAGEITQALSDSNPLVLSVMNGGLVPTGWLLPMLRFPLQLDYIHATRYRGGTRGHDLEWRVRPEIPVQARCILLIDDIFDEGVTLTQVADDCRRRGAQMLAR